MDNKYENLSLLETAACCTYLYVGSVLSSVRMDGR